MSAVLAPSGWGWPQGYPIAGMTAEDLPELPMLRFMERDQRNAAILAMLRENPGLTNVIRPADLQKKYAIPQSTASTLLMKAKK